MITNTRIFITACWVTMALSCVEARPQDTSRVPDTNPQPATDVDASVHADVQDGLKQQPQPAAQPNKRAPTYSKWGFPSATQSPATQFRPAQATTSNPAASTNATNLSAFGGAPSRATDSTITPASDTPATDAKSARPDQQLKRDWQSNPFGVSPANSRHDPSTSRQRFDPQVQPLSAQPQTSGFFTPFHGNEFGGISSSSFPNPFPKTYSSSQDQAKVKQRKPLSEKSAEKLHAGAIARSSSDQKKKVSSPLTTKPE
jgi:hypothetical protein